jgi:hypothetical protein
LQYRSSWKLTRETRTKPPPVVCFSKKIGIDEAILEQVADRDLQNSAITIRRFRTLWSVRSSAIVSSSYFDCWTLWPIPLLNICGHELRIYLIPSSFSSTKDHLTTKISAAVATNPQEPHQCRIDCPVVVQHPSRSSSSCPAVGHLGAGHIDDVHLKSSCCTTVLDVVEGDDIRKW